jgi:hypothetical protein
MTRNTFGTPTPPGPARDAGFDRLNFDNAVRDQLANVFPLSESRELRAELMAANIDDALCSRRKEDEMRTFRTAITALFLPGGVNGLQAQTPLAKLTGRLTIQTGRSPRRDCETDQSSDQN